MTSPKRVLPPPGVIDKYPVLPLRDIVVFPHMIVPLFVGREKSIRALEEVMKADKFILLATQKNAAEDDPKPDAVYSAGVLASVLQLLKLPDGTVKVLVEGIARAKVVQYVRTDEYYEAEVEITPEDAARSGRGGGFGAFGRLRIRRLCQAQQEGLARGRLGGGADRRSEQARRHGGLASVGEDHRPAGGAGNDVGRPSGWRNAWR